MKTHRKRPSSLDRRPQSFAVKKSSLPEGVFIVEGIAAILEYIKFKPKSIRKIFVKEKQCQTYLSQLQAMSGLAEIVKEVESLTQDFPATPIWAHVFHEMIDIVQFESILQKDYAVCGSILALDHISDPRNLGAIVRSAGFFGVRHIIVPERRQVLLTQASVNTAQGGFALADLVVVVNLARTIEQLKDSGFWVLGAAMGGEPIENLRGKYDKQVIVLGSEDKGISSNVLSHCDLKVAIGGAKNGLESLNVSVAAGIFMQRLLP